MFSGEGRSGRHSSPSRSFATCTILCYVHQQYQKQEGEAVMLVRKQKTYALLDADGDDDDDGGRSSVPVVSESMKPDSHKKRYRKKILSQEDDNDESSGVEPYLPGRQICRGCLSSPGSFG